MSDFEKELVERSMDAFRHAEKLEKVLGELTLSTKESFPRYVLSNTVFWLVVFRHLAPMMGKIAAEHPDFAEAIIKEAEAIHDELARSASDAGD